MCAMKKERRKIKRDRVSFFFFFNVVKNHIKCTNLATSLKDVGRVFLVVLIVILKLMQWYKCCLGVIF